MVSNSFGGSIQKAAEVCLVMTWVLYVTYVLFTHNCDMNLMKWHRVCESKRLVLICWTNCTTGKTIQVISFLSAIMRKDGVVTDKHRRRNYVSRLQDRKAWKERRELPLADAKWPTCLIIAPSTVVHNWQREFDTVCIFISRVCLYLIVDIVVLFRSWSVQRKPEGAGTCPPWLQDGQAGCWFVHLVW